MEKIRQLERKKNIGPLKIKQGQHH